MNTQLYRINCYPSCFFFSFLAQNCSGFTLCHDDLIFVIAEIFHYLFLMTGATIIMFLKLVFHSVQSGIPNIFLKKNIQYVIHLIFKNGINNIFSSQTSFLLISSDTHASFASKPIKFCRR